MNLKRQQVHEWERRTIIFRCTKYEILKYIQFTKWHFPVCEIYTNFLIIWKFGNSDL